MPTGTCWCGCGTEVGLGSFFSQGHDKIAEAALLAARYDNSVARLIAHHGFGPDKPVRKAALDTDPPPIEAGAGHPHTAPGEAARRLRGTRGSHSERPSQQGNGPQNRPGR